MRYYLGPWQFDPRDEHWHLPIGCRSAVHLRNHIGVFVVPDETSFPSEFESLGRADHAAGLTLAPAAVTRWRAMLGVELTGTTLADALRDTMLLHADPTGESGCLPLLPTRDLVYEIRLGHQWAWRSRLRPLGSLRERAEWSVTRDRVRRELVALRTASREGRFRDTAGHVDEDFHRRVATAMAAKYHVPWDELRPTQWPIEESPLPHRTVITDNFNRADQSDLGTSPEGWGWTTSGSDRWSIVSNQARMQHNQNLNWARADAALSLDDHYSEADVDLQSTHVSHYAGTQVRLLSTGSEAGYQCGFARGAGTIRITVGSTILAEESVESWSFPHRIRTEVDGSTINGYRDGVWVVTVTDTTHGTGRLYTGMRTRRASGTVTCLFDNCEAGDLVPPAPVAARVMLHGI